MVSREMTAEHMAELVLAEVGDGALTLDEINRKVHSDRLGVIVGALVAHGKLHHAPGPLGVEYYAQTPGTATKVARARFDAEVEREMAFIAKWGILIPRPKKNLPPGPPLAVPAVPTYYCADECGRVVSPCAALCIWCLAERKRVAIEAPTDERAWRPGDASRGVESRHPFVPLEKREGYKAYLKEQDRKRKDEAARREGGGSGRAREARR